MADFTITRSRGFFILEPHGEAAMEWVEEHLPEFVDGDPILFPISCLFSLTAHLREQGLSVSDGRRPVVPPASLLYRDATYDVHPRPKDITQLERMLQQPPSPNRRIEQ
jgi:hypothetical protein